jgi:hypothetical protein
MLRLMSLLKLKGTLLEYSQQVRKLWEVRHMAPESRNVEH